MKAAIVVYVALSVSTFVWQFISEDYLETCDGNQGACNAMMMDYGVNAALWPVYLVTWQSF